MGPPNLLFIYADEQAFNTLATYGNSQIEMPNLDRLAQESVVFDQAYVTQPVCTPSRSTLLTGLYPHTNGCTENNTSLRPETPCLPEMITEGEYVTGHFGKWHLGDELFPQHGFDEWISIEDIYNRHFSEGRDRNARSSYHGFLVENGFAPLHGDRFGRGEAARLPEEYSKPAFLGEESSRFIKGNKDRPFVLYVNFLEPHMPYFGPRDDQYEPPEMPLPPNFDAVPDVTQPLKTRVFAGAYREYGHSGLALRTREDWQRMIANYWGLCSLVDTHVGTILDTLEECGLRHDTIVVFTSDHGDMMGSHRLLAKCVMFQEAIRVPMMIRLPGQRKGNRIRGPVSQIDIVPTLLDLLDKPIPDHLQGQSLRELLSTENPCSDRDVFVQWNGPNTGIVGEADDGLWVPPLLDGAVSSHQLRDSVTDPVRTVIAPDGWKLNCSPMGEHELYNLHDDPGETENLFGRGRHGSVAKRLLTRLQQWQERTGDSPVLSDL